MARVDQVKCKKCDCTWARCDKCDAEGCNNQYCSAYNWEVRGFFDAAYFCLKCNERG